MALEMISRFRGSRFAFPIAAIAALALLFISETSYQHASGALDQLGDMGAARLSILELRRAVTDAETGQRGYLLTHRREYLEPYNRALAEVAKELSRLNAYYAKNAQAAPLVRQVTQVVDQKLSEMRITLDLYDQGKERAWQELLLSNIGKETMDGLRNVSDELQRMETAAIETHRKGVYETLLLSRIGVTTMTLLLLVALYFYLRQAAILVLQREERQRETQAERDDLELVVARRTAQLTELAQHLQTIREDERNRLARELHDELGALLTAAKLDLARLKSRLGALTTVTPELGERLTHLGDALNSGIALKRRIIEDLRPSSLDNLGLTAALEILLREFGERAEIEVVRRLEKVRLTPAGQLTIYRLVQEALTNVVKYAHASRVEIALEMRASRAMISVRDNGVGFDPNKPGSGSHGLLGMRYRIEAQGGRMNLTTAPGKGTLIEATLPEGVATPPAAAPTAPKSLSTPAEDAALPGVPVR
ncbi:MAG TPA: CHASE3 domain-containing protein [Burkholderiaceae bacterium]|nr:CHASE3 domain-containing protein [Burkholderiaceae bacterium]